MRERATPLAIGLLLVAHTANADVPRCASGVTHVDYQKALFDELSGDTGWFPASSPAQLRLTGHIAGMTTVAMGLAPTACWDGPMTVAAPGVPGTGRLDFAYGADLHAYAQIHTTILGNPIDWAGELPLPTDFLLDHTSTFDPIASASGSDHTSPLKLISTDLIGELISITGISGGLHLDAIGAVTTTYRTTGVSVGNVPSGELGATLDLPVSAAGVISYAPAITFNVGFNVKIIGIQVVDFTLFGVTLPLPTIDVPVVLSGSGTSIPLPKAPSLAGARIDFASGGAQALTIRDLGAAPLVIEATDLPTGVTMPRVTIEPGEDGVLSFTAAAGAESGIAVLATNDPGQPTISVLVGNDVGGTGFGEEGANHAGCDIGGSKLSPLVIVVCVLLRRRRPR